MVQFLTGLLLAAWPVMAQPACDDITTFASGLAPTSEIHVSPTGNDQTGDGSVDNPYASIELAIDLATPGTGVVIHEGTYPGGMYAANVQGEPGAPIWIGGAAGEARPIISGGNTALQMVRARYVVMHDLEVTGAALNGINFDDGGEVDDPTAAEKIVFQRLHIHDISSGGNNDALKLSGLDDYWVLDCVIERVSAGSGIDHVGCHQGLIARCTFDDMGSNAIQIKGGSEDIEVRWCRFTDGGQRTINIGGSTGFQFFRPPLSTREPNAEARNIRVLANAIEGATASVAFVGAVDCLVAHNTIDTPEGWIIRILQETVSTDDYEFLPCGNNQFSSNIVLFDHAELSTYVNIGPNTAPETFSFAHNLWYAYDDPDASEPTLPTDEVNGIYALDPLLTDPESGDYTIPGDSPAAGSALAPAPIDADFAGACYQDPPSIGAHEVPCGADFNGDGKVNVLDFIDFQSAWQQNDPAADCDASGSFDVLDFVCFQSVFQSGC